jgi:hypothetical protein
MPTITFADGTSSYIPDKKPETIAKAKRIHAENKKGDVRVLGDVGRQSVRGLQKIGEGIATTVSTGIDLFADTDLTADVKEHFEKIDVGEAETTAGEITRYMVQFGIPGFGVAGVLGRMGKMGKVKAALAGGLVDGAVATDDVVTLKDTFFDNESESDELRMSRLRGAEAAAARLQDKLEVAAEGAGFILGIPLAGKAIAKTGGAAIDFVAPVGSFMAKGVMAGKKVLRPGELQKSAFDSNTGIYNALKRNFTYGGDKVDTYVASTMAAKTAQIKAAQESVDAIFDTVLNTTGIAVNNGVLNQRNALKLSRNIEDFMFPRIRVDYQFPNLSVTEKIAKANQIKKVAEQNIKTLENQYIDYKSLGFGDNNKISELLKANRDTFDTYSKQILEYSDDTADGFMNLFVPPELRDAIAENAGLYGTRVYKAIVDKGYTINPEYKAKALKEIERTFGVDPREANEMFEGLINPGPKNKNSFAFETNEMFLEGLNRDQAILKGRKLSSLPQVRRALGESAGYLESNWQTALANTKLTASVTAQRLSALTAKTQMFDNLKMLDDSAAKTGVTKFLKPQSAFRRQDGSVPTEQIITDQNGKRVLFKKFDKEAGALEGSFAREDVHDAIMGATSDELANTNALRKAYTAFLSVKAASQYGKTVLSGGAQVRNFTSIPFFSMLNGNLGSTGRFVDAVEVSFAGLFDPKKRILKADSIKELIEEGMMQKGGANLGEIQEIAKLASGMNADNYFGAASRAVGKAVDKSGIRLAEKAYGMTDDAGRVFGYLNEKSRLAQALKIEPNAFVPIQSPKNMTRFADLIESGGGVGKIKPQDIINRYGEEGLERFVRSEAGEVAGNTIQNYQRIVPFVSTVIRNSPLGNFVAFPSEIIRNTANAVSRGITELASENTAIQKIGMRRLTGAVATTSMLPAGLVSLGSALTGVEKEKIDAYKRSFAAPWDRTASLIPIASDKNGHPTQFINFSYMNPYDYLKRPVERVFQEVANGNRNEESNQEIFFQSLASGLGEFMTPFVDPAFSLQAALEARNGETSTGKKIWGVSNTTGDKIAKGLYHFIDTALPTITPYRLQADMGVKKAQFMGVEFSPPTGSLKNFPRAVFGSTNGKGEDEKIIDRMGREIDVAETMVQAFTGLKVIKPQVERTLRYRGFEANDAIKDATNQLNRLLRSNDPQGAQRILQGYINQNESRFRVLRDMYAAIEDARALGLPERVIEQQLKEAKVANYKQVMRGVFKPIEASPDLVRASTMRGTTDINPSVLPLAQQKMRQDLQGKFLNPLELNAQQRAAQVLREEEEKKILGTP